MENQRSVCPFELCYMQILVLLVNLPRFAAQKAISLAPLNLEDLDKIPPIVWNGALSTGGQANSCSRLDGE